ncbi:integral membrane protein-like protein [Cucurbitaria berberidis CBS 394.84]|uniref:Integral membrane protein-like protein n=1 Tax=Cucurbitaria berberidis CBS 394.84 TaxID=1168544 RepID=A0A9P4GQ92_9PLEO|nr:integral membrane protein-like protein [Cucurbitaria berberidis CBS 394.84]KAF1849161.1 integral membrane protein-like protein [Cucurbitaria berberidis CBS 394.84]
MHFSTRLVTGIAVFIALTFLYTITSISARDPTSVFFNPRKGYAPRYSTIRRQQAEAYISSYNPSNVVKAGEEKKRKLCVGIPSFRREDAQYLPDAVGSLLEGLTPEERQEIYLIVFLAHSKPAAHPAYSEKWLSGLADKVMTYEFGADRLQYIVELEAKEGKFDEKALFDYSLLLTKCVEQFTPYIAIFEDDTVAMDGWYHRTIAAIHEAEQQAALRRSKPDFLYLRLFYTEQFLGYHAENWKRYLFNSICIALLPTITILLMRFTKPTTKLSLKLTTRRTFVIIYAILAIVLLLLLSLGHVTLFPIPTGVHEMRKFGCCSQALVFPNTKALDLVNYFKERHLGYVDVLTEDFANERGELRYAVTPNLVQHVGRTRSKGDDYVLIRKWGMRAAEKIWSFTFENHDWRALKKEHEEVTKLRGEGGGDIVGENSQGST